MKLLQTALFALLVAAPAAAQIPVNITIGPDPVPVGSRLSMTFSHDGPFLVSTGGCPFEVFDDQMNLVWSPGCTPVAISVGPYGVLTRYWNQTDNSGQPVPPGDYYVKVNYDFQGPTFHPITIDPATEVGIVFEGTPTIGSPFGGGDRNFFLSAPNDAGFGYWLMASLSSSVGIPTCNGTIPLDFSPLFLKSLSPNKIFKNSVGFLSGTGETTAPTFPIPEDPSVVGISVFAAWAVVDFADTVCPFLSMSEAYELTII